MSILSVNKRTPPTLTVLIGLPRAGKTTFLKSFKTDQVTISADNFRQLMYGHRFYANGEGMMWATRDICLKILMQQHVSIIVDETNITVAHRAKLIKLAKDNGYHTGAIWIDTDPVICAARADNTDQADLKAIIAEMHAKLQPPEYAEGFDKIVYLGQDATKAAYYD